MAVRDIYLKIETISGYSPVEPDDHVTPPIVYRRDCMRNMGHEDGTIPVDEVNARRLTALIYREYLDSHFLVPKPDKLIAADVNEPAYTRRVPGTVIYAQPGDVLHIHVKNADITPHSFHLHGLRYGIDSDGSWPFGTQSTDGRRSDEICPGQTWTYTYEATEQIGWRVAVSRPLPQHRRLHRSRPLRRAGRPSGEGMRRPAEVPATRRLLRASSQDGRRSRQGASSRDAPQASRAGTQVRLRASARRADASHEPVARRRGPIRRRDEPHAGAHSWVAWPSGHGDDRSDADADAWHGRHGSGMRARHGSARRARGAHSLHRHAGRARACAAAPAASRAHAARADLLSRDERDARDAGVSECAAQSRRRRIASPVFSLAATYNYMCGIHGPSMSGSITVQAGGPSTVNVAIGDFFFAPANVVVGVGGQVVWTNNGPSQHSVVEQGGANLPSYCFNGRSFIGNTPTIVAHAGQRIRWYVFNLDLSMNWHNFHPHAQRWRFADETIDVRGISPAESFMVETTAPPVLLLPPELEKAQHPHHHHKHAKEYHLRGDFLVHCHVEMHMMLGLAALVRSHQTVWLTPAEADELSASIGLPLDPGNNNCPTVALDRCQLSIGGRWEVLPGLPEITFMHAVLLANSTRILYWGYGQRPDQARLWDQTTGLYTSPANQPIAIAADENIWSGAHAQLNDAQGTVLLHGGFMTGGGVSRGHRATRVPVQSVDQQLQCSGGAHDRPVLPDHPDAWRRHSAHAVRRRSRECGGRRCPVTRDLHAGRRRRVERAEGRAVQLLLLPVDLPAARWRSVHRRTAEAGAAIQSGGHADRRRSGCASTTRSPRSAASTWMAPRCCCRSNRPTTSRG